MKFLISISVFILLETEDGSNLENRSVDIGKYNLFLSQLSLFI